MPLSFPTWKESPFLRLLFPLITGILLQWYLSIPVVPCWIAITATSAGLLFLHPIPTHLRFRLRSITGILINVLIILCGIIITWYHHPDHSSNAITTRYASSHSVHAVVQEPLSQKKNSYKATARVTALTTHDQLIHANGNIILYFSLAVDPRDILYGSIIIINKPLQPVKSSGNPGAFDYHRYCTFNQTSYQVHLQPGEFSITSRSETRGLKKFIFQCREKVISILRKYINGPQEAALAEALLIGYKDELDKELVQAYSNTGVVHIIAVSGMHLGIVYWLLSLLVRPFRKDKTKWITAVIVLSGLWAFSLLAGAGPSVLRSAFMFSLIVIGETFSKRNNIYNNLAASAFLLLCWNPYWLWDAGFQLSYAAVLSIVLLFRPIYNLLYVRNKMLDAIWKLNAVTLAAQVLTIPVSIYHFHQFPNLFIIANLLAVPLSSLLLIGEIVLCAVSFIPTIAEWTGSVLNLSLGFLNNFIQRINELPFASWQHLQLDIAQVALLYAFIAAVMHWFWHKHRHAFVAGLCMMVGFVALRTHSFVTASLQRSMVIYNIPKHRAIDFMEGRRYYFAGDDTVQQDRMIRMFHVDPSRTLHRVSAAEALPGLLVADNLYLFHGKKVLVASGQLPALADSMDLDVLVVSKNPRPGEGTVPALKIKQVVADGSNSSRTTRRWKEFCQSLHIPFHSVTESGAYILTID